MAWPQASAQTPRMMLRRLQHQADSLASRPADAATCCQLEAQGYRDCLLSQPVMHDGRYCFPAAASCGNDTSQSAPARCANKCKPKERRSGIFLLSKAWPTASTQHGCSRALQWQCQTFHDACTCKRPVCMSDQRFGRELEQVIQLAYLLRKRTGNR
jgi:hypothetical protein